MPTPFDSADDHWRLTAGAALSIRVWGDDCVVHHALSNDTHRLAAWLVPALERLGQGPCSARELAELTASTPAALRDALNALEPLLLVQRC